MSTLADYQKLFLASRQRYTKYYLDFLSNQSPDSPLLRRKKQEILQAIRYDLENTSPSYSWITPISKLLNRTGDYPLATEFLHKVINYAPDEMKLEAFLSYGIFLRKLGNMDAAISSYQTGCILAEKHKDIEKLAQLNTKLGFALCQIGEIEKGEHLLLEALPVLQNSNGDEALCDIYLNLGYVFDDKGDYANTFHYLNLAIEIAQRASLTLHLMNAYINLSATYDNFGDSETAREYAQKAVEFAKKDGFIEADGFGSLNLGVFEYRKDNLPEAKSFLEYAVATAKQIGHTRMLISGLMNLSITVEKMGEIQKALNLLDEAIQMVSGLDDPKMLTMLLYEKAASLLNYKEWLEAIRFFTDAHDLATKYGYRDYEGKALFGIAFVNRELGKIDIAIEKAHLSHQILAEIQHSDQEKVSRFLKDPEGYNE